MFLSSITCYEKKLKESYQTNHTENPKQNVVLIKIT